jgi:hypothetical protein
LANFFDAVRGNAKLNCPAEAGFAATVAALKINEAVAAARTLKLESEEFVA